MVAELRIDVTERPPVADAGTASNVDSSCEYIE